MGVQVPRRDQPAVRRKHHAAAATKRIVTERLRRLREKLGGGFGVQMVDGRKLHGVATTATKHRAAPVPVSIVTGTYA